MATADQCGFIRRNELLLVIFAGLWKMLRSSPFLMEILPCPSGRPTSGMESNFSATDNPNVAVRMPDKPIYLAGQGCLVHRTPPLHRDVGILPMPGGPVEINTTGSQYLNSPAAYLCGFQSIGRVIGSSGFIRQYRFPFSGRDG